MPKDIRYLKGVGEKRAELFAKKGIRQSKICFTIFRVLMRIERKRKILPTVSREKRCA